MRPLTIEDRPSPHLSRGRDGQPRPRRAPISAVVLHDTRGKTAESALRWFEDPASKVSAHFVIDRDGTTYRCVADEHVAWHAGTSELWGDPDVNEYSVGIELVDQDDADPYPDAQLGALIELAVDLCWRYRIPLNRVVGHQHVARPRGRKTDPGRDFPFWEVLVAVGAQLGARMEP